MTKGEAIGEIFETTDYTLFKKLKGNRDPKSVQKIVASIRKVGYVLSPVCVNEKMEVIDGQNRVIALEQLELPVHYYIAKGAGLEEARNLNIGQANWTTRDYIESYAVSGDSDYKRFRALLLEHKNYTIQELYGICKNVVVESGNNDRILREGELELTDAEAENASATIEYLDLVRSALKSVPGNGRTKTTVLSWMLNFSETDKNRLIKVVNEKYPVFDPVVKGELFMRDISKYYNKRIQNPIDFDIEYRQSLKK